MVDLGGQERGNISLPAKLQSYVAENEEEEEDIGALKKEKPTIINLQRTLYNIKLADIENKIDRLEKRNDELLEEIETIDEDTATVDAATAEEIANLGKHVFSQDEAVRGLKFKLQTLEENRIKDKKSLQEAIELFNQRYKKEKVKLVSQIKVLSAKINILEDFKKIQASLEEKLKDNQEQIAKKEEKIKQILKDIKRTTEFDKEMLKNDMYNCLLGLAADFQLETSKHISLPNQRLMRENVMLKNELLQISETISSKMDSQTHLKNSEIEHMKRIKTRTSMIKQNIITVKVQAEVLKRLRKRFGNMQQLFLSVNIPDPGAEEKYLTLIERAEQEQNEANFRLSSLKTLLHKDRTKVSVTKYLLKTLECKIRAAVETIYDVKYTVMCLLKCPSSRKDLRKLSCIELFLFLRDTLNQGQSKLGNFIIKSLESIPRELDHVVDFEGIHEPFDLEVITELTENESSTREVAEKTEQKEKPTELSSGSEGEETPGEIVSDELPSVPSTPQESYDLYGEDEFEGEFDMIDE